MISVFITGIFTILFFMGFYRFYELVIEFINLMAETYIKESYRPKGFMDLNFIAKQKDFKVSSDNYRMRLCSTNVENIYVLTAAGHDQYLWKMIKIIFGAIFLTLIAVPITIAITKKTFKIKEF